MSSYKREIGIVLMTALVTLSAVYLLFGDMKKGQTMMQTDLYSLTASSSNAVLAVNRPNLFKSLMLDKPPVYQLFATHIPEIFLHIIKRNPKITDIHLSFHPQGGIIMYAKANESTAEAIEKELQQTFFPAFAPQQQEKDDITFTYCPEAGNRFFGYYYYNGIWVASYSKKLLEEVSTLQRIGKDNQPREWTELRKTLDTNAPLNLLFQSKLLDLSVQQNDSTQWRINDNWLATDLFMNEGNLCYFSSLTYSEANDSLYQLLSDTLTVRLRTLFPPFSVTNQITMEDEQVFFSGQLN